MEVNDNAVSFPMPTTRFIIPSTIKTSNTIDTFQPKKCPLCNSEVKLFFINLNEKIVMCENTQCEFPFGYEELQFYKENNEIEGTEEVETLESISVKMSNTPTCSMISDTSTSEIERMNKAFECEDSQTFDKPHVHEFFKFNKTKEMESKTEEELLKNKINSLKNIDCKIKHMNEKKVVIQNPMFLKTLGKMNKKKKLLNSHEMNILNKNTVGKVDREVKVDIIQKDDNITIDLSV